MKNGRRRLTIGDAVMPSERSWYPQGIIGIYGVISIISWSSCFEMVVAERCSRESGSHETKEIEA